MSRKQHTNATLSGWDGPYFPSNIQQLNETLAELWQPIDCEVFERWCKRVLYFVAMQSPAPISADGYQWYAAACFKTLIGPCKVLIAFPCFDDASGVDESSADRSVAVYTIGAPDRKFYEHIVQKIIEEI